MAKEVTMRIKFFIPRIEKEPEGCPEECPHCGCRGFHIHQHVEKNVIDHIVSAVKATRHKCKACKRTLRWYPEGVSRDHQGAAVKAMSVILYVLGLSYDNVSGFLHALGVRPRGSARGLWDREDNRLEGYASCRPEGSQATQEEEEAIEGRGESDRVDTTAYKVKGKGIVTGTVTDVLRGEVLEIEILDAEDEEEIKEWIRELVEELGVEVIISDDADCYKEVAEGLGLKHQVCVAHVRKWVKRRTKELMEGASSTEEAKELIADCERVRELVKELPPWGDEEMKRMHFSYTWAPPPRKGEEGSPFYWMRMMTLRLWENWSRLRLFKEWEWEDGEGRKWRFDGTNNVTEREIGRCGKIRYKVMRGYKSEDGGM